MPITKYLALALVALSFSACKLPAGLEKTESKTVPAKYGISQDTVNSAKTTWNQYFNDPYLVALIDTALKNNQELNITLQEIQIARNEIRERKGEYLPFVDVRAGAETEKVGRYTSKGSSEATTDIRPGAATPDPLPNFGVGLFATWQVDIWGKLHNAKRAAVNRYMASVEGKNFMVTTLIAEIANSYYELLALDSELAILKQNLELQSNAFQVVKLQKDAARVTELAVRRFEAQMLRTQSMQFDIQQKITETENHINFLVGRFPQPVARDASTFADMSPTAIQAGIPSQLLENRPDVKQAEQNLLAAKLDVKVARANFYPSLNINAGVGFQAYSAAYLLRAPESLLFALAGEIAGPLINRNSIKASYYSANAKQVQAVYNYEKTVLMAYIEVANQLSNISNLRSSYEIRAKQVEALTASIDISNNLFNSARADYMEVLLTQRDALESRFELIETRKQQMNAMVNIYQALGGGWN